MLSKDVVGLSLLLLLLHQSCYTLNWDLKFNFIYQFKVTEQIGGITQLAECNLSNDLITLKVVKILEWLKSRVRFLLPPIFFLLELVSSPSPIHSTIFQREKWNRVGGHYFYFLNIAAHTIEERKNYLRAAIFILI